VPAMEAPPGERDLRAAGDEIVVHQLQRLFDGVEVQYENE